jgi:RNA polymerase sigma factor (sigma-70 family)
MALNSSIEEDAMAPGHPEERNSADEAAFRIARLVRQARTGDQTAFHRLADRFHGEIFRMIYYRVRSRMDAEDLTQDVFLKVFRSLNQLQSEHLFKSWLYRIAVNRVRDFFRRKAFTSIFGILSIDDPDFQESGEMASAAEADKAMDRRAFWQQVGDMLNTLPRLEREVFLLRFFDDLTIKEISSVLKKNENTIKTHLYRSLKKVKAAAARMDDLMEGL